MDKVHAETIKRLLNCNVLSIDVRVESITILDDDICECKSEPYEREKGNCTRCKKINSNWLKSQIKILKNATAN